MYRLLSLLIIAVIFSFVNISAQKENFDKSNDYRREAFQKYKENNYEGFLRATQKANELRKNHPSLFYNIALGYALTNKPDSALLYLNKIADMKLSFPAEKDSDFVSLWNAEEFNNITSKFDNAKKQHGKSELAFSLSEKDLLTESVAYNPDTKTFYVGSVHKRKIFLITENGKVELFAESGENNFGGVFGIKVDSKNNLLWACAGYLPQMEGYAKDQNEVGEVLKFDLTSKKLIKKHTIEEGTHLFGDLVLDSKGNVYISDSRDNNIYIIEKDGNEIKPFLVSDNFASLQGIDFSSDGKYLFAADYAMGLYKIKMSDKSISAISVPDDLTDLGLDGLYFYKNSLIGIQNGVPPQRVVKLNLDRDFSGITSWEVIEANNEHFFEPTLGVLNGDEFYYIANSQWPLFKNDGTVDTENLQEPVVLKTKLK